MQTSSLGTKVAVGSAIAVLLAALAALLVLKAFFISYYFIPQNGMYPGLPAGSVFFALQHPYAAPARVKRADIVVFTRDTDAGRYVYIWRVVGLPGDTIEAEDVQLGARSDVTAAAIGPHLTLKEARAEFEKQFILSRLREFAGNISRTADALGMERSNLHRKLHAYGIRVERP